MLFLNVCSVRRRANESFQFVVISLKGSFYEKARGLVGIWRDVAGGSSKTLTLDVSSLGLFQDCAERIRSWTSISEVYVGVTTCTINGWRSLDSEAEVACLSLVHSQSCLVNLAVDHQAVLLPRDRLQQAHLCQQLSLKGKLPMFQHRLVLHLAAEEEASCRT